MTACEREREQIGALLDGELEAGERAALEAHLADCAGCRQALEDQRQLAAAFAALPAVEPAPDFEARFWARIAREADAPKGFAARLRRLALAGPRARARRGGRRRAAPVREPAARRPSRRRDSEPTVEPQAAAEPRRPRAGGARPAPGRHRRAYRDRAISDFELLQDPEVDAISELDVLEEWDDAGPS